MKRKLRQCRWWLKSTLPSASTSPSPSEKEECPYDFWVVCIGVCIDGLLCFGVIGIELVEDGFFFTSRFCEFLALETFALFSFIIGVYLIIYCLLTKKIKNNKILYYSKKILISIILDIF